MLEKVQLQVLLAEPIAAPEAAPLEKVLLQVLLSVPLFPQV